MRILITGITGMAGSHLAEYLLEQRDCEVHGTVRWKSNWERISEFAKDLYLHECDLNDAHAVYRIIRKIRPQRIYHLAAQSNVTVSCSFPHDTLMNNIFSQLNLFEAIRKLNLCKTRIHISGSSEEYGLVHENELPVKETNEVRPISPYAVSKVTQNTMAYQYHKSFGLNIVRTRAFNHTGPRRGEQFVTSNFAKQIAEIEFQQKKPVIRVGNLTVKRDFTDVRDMVRAYVTALEEGEPGEVYNIGSGKAHSIQQVLSILLNMSKIQIEVRKDPARFRLSDIPVLVCDNTKFIKKTGWKPLIPFEETLFDLLTYWREKIAQERHFEKLEPYFAETSNNCGKEHLL